MIGQVLHRSGLTQLGAQPNHRATPPVAAEAPNALMTIDHRVEFRTGNGQCRFLLAVQDAHSRYLRGRWQDSSPVTCTALNKAFQKVGQPRHPDNEFGGLAASVRPGHSGSSHVVAETGQRH